MTNVSSIMLARAQQRHDSSLDEMLAEIDIGQIERSGVYFGEPCAKCRCDVIPIDGSCPWCSTPLVDVA